MLRSCELLDRNGITENAQVVLDRLYVLLLPFNVFFFKFNLIYFLDTFILKLHFWIIKVNNFRGDSNDISHEIAFNASFDVRILEWHQMTGILTYRLYGIVRKMKICEFCTARPYYNQRKSFHGALMATSASVSSEITVRSPWKSFTFITLKNFFWIKVSEK